MANYNLFDAASLAMVPVGYKANKLYSVKPDTGDGDFTFSRASYATRVNADGNIEKERGNLILQSNQFDTTWGLGGGTLTSGQAGYDGTNNAWLFNYTSAPNIVNQVNTFDGVQTLSVYAKGSVTNGIRLYAFGSTNVNAYFDLNIGAVESTQSVINAEIQDKGNGWYRCIMTFNQTNSNIYMYLTGNNNSNAGSGSVFIQDAQLEQGLVATEYIETTTAAVYKGVTDNIPRIDYTSGCGSLLLEPQRTNGILSSEDFTHSSWITQTGISVVQNTTDTTSPEGVYNAAKITSTSGSFGIYTSAFTTTSPVTRSVYLKGENGGETLRIKDGSGNGGQTNITLTTEWVRYEHKTTNDGLPYQGMYLDDISTSGAVYVYGAQYEVGTYPTSYIPTYGSSVTRVDESCKNTTITDFQTSDATLFFEFNYDSSKTGNFRYVFSTENSTSANFDLISLQSTSAGSAFSFSISNSGISFSNLSLSSGINKVLIKFERSTGAVKTFLNGVSVDSATATSIPEIHKIALGGRLNAYSGFSTDRELGDVISQALAFPTALTDNECKALTRPYDTYQEWVDGEGLTWESKSCTTQSILELQNL